MSEIDRSRGCDCCLMAQENWTISPTMISTQHLHLMAPISLISINIVAAGGPGAPARYWAHYIWIIELGLVTALTTIPPSWTLVQVLTARGATSAPRVSSSGLKTVQVARFAQNLQSTFGFHNILAAPAKTAVAERNAALLRSSHLIENPHHKYSRVENRSLALLKLRVRDVMSGRDGNGL